MSRLSVAGREAGRAPLKQCEALACHQLLGNGEAAGTQNRCWAQVGLAQQMQQGRDANTLASDRLPVVCTQAEVDDGSRHHCLAVSSKARQPLDAAHRHDCNLHTQDRERDLNRSVRGT